MFDFCHIGGGLYCLYKNGERVNPLPLTRAELDEAILALPLSDAESAAIDYFCTQEVR